MSAFITCKDEEFAIWAFGDVWFAFAADRSLGVMMLLDAWNALHGDRLQITEDELISDSLIKMENLFKEDRCKETTQE